MSSCCLPQLIQLGRTMAESGGPEAEGEGEAEDLLRVGQEKRQETVEALEAKAAGAATVEIAVGVVEVRWGEGFRKKLVACVRHECDGQRVFFIHLSYPRTNTSPPWNPESG